MTVQGALRAGYTLWKDGRGWWANDGVNLVGPRPAQRKLLMDVEAVEDAGADLVVEVTSVEIQRAQAKLHPGEPLLCVGCHKLQPSGTQFDKKGRCPACHTPPLPRSR